MKKNWKVFIAVVLISLIGISLYYFVFNKEQAVIAYSEFITLVDEESIEQVIIKNEDMIEVVTKEEQVFTTNNPLTDDFKEFLLLKGIDVQTASDNMEGALSMLFVIAVFVGVYFMMNKDKIADKQFAYNIKKDKNFEEKSIDFDSVAGNYEAKEMLRDIIDFISDPEKYNHIGANMPRGVLLYGSPGTGKTLLAKAIAGEANVPFYALSGSDFVQMYVGVGAKRVRELFAKARKSQKAIIFIDEIDAIGKSRASKANSNNDERDQTLNALLTEMSGFNDSDGIVVIGATNRLDILDPALLRPGRFDRQIEVALPDRYAREDILKLYLSKRPIHDDIDINKLALKTSMFSGAMLSNLVNEGAIIAANNDEKIIRYDHIEEAFYNVVAGKDKQFLDQFIDKKEMKITAIHEAGHALITKLLCPDVKIDKITIIPTSKGAAGYNYNIYKDKMYKTRKEIINNIRVLLAGRAAEEIVLGKEKVTTGCVNDIKKASEQIYEYYKVYGMDEDYGIINIESIGDEQELSKRCREKLNSLYGDVIDILLENRHLLDDLIERLYENEILSGEEVIA